MKTAIVYYSKHHGNTEKLVQAIAANHEVSLINVLDNPEMNLDDYDRIGLASGIYYSNFAKQILSFAANHLPEGKEVFLIATCGNERKNYFDAIRKILSDKRCTEVGSYLCLGFDTFGPFKLVGGIAKGHPTQEEIDGAVRFYENLK
ncbi:MAG: flavodoxin [Parasporobacterium sp.]|nr:flavodoxin [Parasporobacterium sp.]